MRRTDVSGQPQMLRGRRFPNPTAPPVRRGSRARGEVGERHRRCRTLMSLPTVAGVPTDVLFTSCFCFEQVRRSDDRTISPVRRFEGLSPAGRSPTPSRASESLTSGECAPKKDARGDRSPSSLAADVEPSPARGLSDERVVLRSIEFFVFICWLPARSCSFCGDRLDSSAVLPPLESVPPGTLLLLLPTLSCGDLLSGDDVEHCSPDAGSAVPGSRTLMSASLSAVYDQHRRKKKKK